MDDGTRWSLARGRADVEAARKSAGGQRQVQIGYVYRSPENSVDGAAGRAVRSGRPVPVAVLAEAHAGAPKVVKALAEEYAGDDRVSFTFIWNDGAITDAREIKVEEVPDVDQAQAERIFREALEVARQEGRVDDELYSAFGGSQLRQDDAGRAANSGPEQPARNALTQDPAAGGVSRSEEHTSELQSLMRISYA